MRRGLKYKLVADIAEEVKPIRRFPDEEGTEILPNTPCLRFHFRPPIRRFPDEEGTEMNQQGNHRPGGFMCDQKIPR